MNLKGAIPFSIILCLVLLAPLKTCYAKILVLDPDQNDYWLGSYLEILEDKNKEWTIEDVTTPELASRFYPNTELIPNFGLTDSAIWIRFELKNDSPVAQSWVILQKNSYAFFVELVELTEDSNNWSIKRSGRLQPDQGALPYRYPAFEGQPSGRGH